MTTTLLKHSSKTQALGEHLTRLARSLEPNTKLPTMQELRRDLNVSIATLDSALTKLESQNVIYRKHGIGIFVSPRLGEKCIGLVVGPEFFQAGTSPFWQELLEGVRSRAESKGESSRFYMALDGREGRPVKDDLAEDICAGRLDGVIFIGCNEEAVQWIEEQGVPLAGFAGRFAHKVVLDYEAVVEAGVRLLAKRGCRRIAFLRKWDRGDEELEPGELTTLSEHFIACLAAAGLPLEPGLLQDGAHFADAESTNQMQGFEAIQRMWDGACVPPDGLIVNDDMTTRGALVALGKRGVEVGRDIQIVTHSNRGSAVLHGYEDDLTRIEFDSAELVSALFDLLETRMNGTAAAQTVVSIQPYLHPHLDI